MTIPTVGSRKASDESMPSRAPTPTPSPTPTPTTSAFQNVNTPVHSDNKRACPGSLGFLLYSFLRALTGAIDGAPTSNGGQGGAYMHALGCTSEMPALCQLVLTVANAPSASPLK